VINRLTTLDVDFWKGFGLAEVTGERQAPHDKRLNGCAACPLAETLRGGRLHVDEERRGCERSGWERKRTRPYEA
jgi:hypothetical protein